jgi:hypothetical protein
MVDPLPSASFGKPGGATAYQVIDKHSAFDAPEIARAFRTICTSFEWKPTGGDSIHPPCYATLAVGSSVLIAEYTDAGRDSAGRPHTLLINCLLTSPPDAERAWASLAGEEIPVPVPTAGLRIIGDRKNFSTTSAARASLL